MKFSCTSSPVIAAIVAVLAFSCGKTDVPATTSALKLTAALSPYFGAGKTEIPVWSPSDNLVVADITASTLSTARPAVAGSNETLFSVKLEAAKDGDTMLAFRKSEGADVSGGCLEFDVPAVQNGVDINPVLAGIFRYNSKKTSGEKITLSSTCSVLLVNVTQDNYIVTKMEVTATGGEKIAGRARMNPADGSFSATESTVTVNVRNTIHSDGTVQIPVMIVPGVLAKGYKIKFYTDKGSTFELTDSESVEFLAGSCVESGRAAEDTVRKLLVCGSNKVYLFNKEKVNWGESYANGLIWSWDCTSVSSTFPQAKSNSHIDDTKIVNNKRQLLVTCSNNSGWCVLLEPDYSKPSGASLLFWTASAPNAHSAEYLPGGYVVVACSVDGGDCLQLYSIKKNNAPLSSYPLVSAHGAVWNPATERLYAIGGTTLQTYKWNPSVPALEKEREISTTGYVSGLHDISLVDANTLILGGGKCALYNISKNSFTQVAHFNPSGLNGIKSLNYNPGTGELFYTFAVKGTSEGDYDWSSHKVRYTDDINGNSEKTIQVNDINMYKVRVFTW